LEKAPLDKCCLRALESHIISKWIFSERLPPAPDGFGGPMKAEAKAKAEAEEDCDPLIEFLKKENSELKSLIQKVRAKSLL
jgi:hypothetical protein